MSLALLAVGGLLIFGFVGFGRNDDKHWLLTAGLGVDLMVLAGTSLSAVEQDCRGVLMPEILEA